MIRKILTKHSVSAVSLLGCFVFAVSCGRNGHHTPAPTDTRVNNVPGEDSSVALLIGQGLNSVKNEAKGHCVDVGDLATESGNSAGQIAEFEMLEVSSESALRSSLNISASASFGSLFGKGSARMNYADSVNKNSQSKYLMVHTRVANQMELAKSFTFKSDAIKLITENRMQEFTDKCGNQFVYGRKTGGEFYAVFEFEMTSEDESRAFSAAVSASGTGWKAAADINTALAQFNKHSLLQVRMLKFGGGAGLPQVENLKDFALNFDKMTSAISGAPVTLELITKDYSGVEPITTKPNYPAIERQLYVLELLAKARDEAEENVNSLKYIAKNEKSYDVNGFDYTETQNKLNAFINNINSEAVDCFGDSTKCALPTDLPSMKLPQRKASGSIWVELKTNNWAFNYPATPGASLDGRGGNETSWIVNPKLSFVLSDGQKAVIATQLLEADCASVFSNVEEIGKNFGAGSHPFDANEALEVISAYQCTTDFIATQVSFALRDKKSGKCLEVYFYTPVDQKRCFSMSSDAEIATTISKIVQSFKKI